jgi:site-specific recombinase XerD
MTIMTTTDCTLHEAAEAYLEHLKEAGKKERTIYTYSRDFEQIEAFFGKDRRLAAILAAHVGKFLKSDALLKLPSGLGGIQKSRAKPTVDKTVRVLRMFLVWAHQSGRLAKLPLPKDTPMGRSQTGHEGEGDER